MPDLYRQLLQVETTLENHYRDVQDVEFTIQGGKVWMLQTRNAKRTGFAAVRIAVDMVNEGLIDEKTALQRVAPDRLNQLLQPMFDPAGAGRVPRPSSRAACRPAPARPAGRSCSTPPTPRPWAKQGKAVDPGAPRNQPRRPARHEGGQGHPHRLRRHASARGAGGAGMGKACIVGCGELNIDLKARTVSVGDTGLAEGDVDLDRRLHGRSLRRHRSPARQDAELEPAELRAELMALGRQVPQLEVRTNADAPEEAEGGARFGAEGIGLCRTEHMFFERRIDDVREMILADDEAGRRKALAKLLPLQRDDFDGLFRAMNGRPVTIRLLDPPLHEFLPHDEAGQKAMAQQIGVSPAKIRTRVEELHEFNPMLGHRGCRLGIVYPEITGCRPAPSSRRPEREGQGHRRRAEIMIPLVGFGARIQ